MVEVGSQTRLNVQKEYRVILGHAHSRLARALKFARMAKFALHVYTRPVKDRLVKYMWHNKLAYLNQ